MTFTIFYVVQRDPNNWASSFSGTTRGIEADSKEVAKELVKAQFRAKYPEAIFKEMRARKTSK